MSTCDVNHERGAALLITVMVLTVVTALIAYASLQLTENNEVSEAQIANYNQARTAAMIGISGITSFLNQVQNSPNTATSSSSTTNCGSNGVCQFVGALTQFFWGNNNGEVIPPNGGLGAIGYLGGQQVSINNISLKNISPYINATVSVHIIGNTYQTAIPATNSTSATPAAPGLITIISQGQSGHASATAEAVLGPVMPATPGAVNTTLSLAGTTTAAGQIINIAPAAQHTYLSSTGTLSTPSGQAPQGFTQVIQNATTQQVSISANTLQSQANIIFIPPATSGGTPQIEFQNIGGNSKLGNGPYNLSSAAISQGVCVSSLGCGTFFGIPYGTRVPIFAQGTSVSYINGTWEISGTSNSPALLIPGAAFFNGNVSLGPGTFDNAIISNGNITDNATVYAPNYAGPTPVCGTTFTGNISQVLFPTNFCGQQGTQFIPVSIGNLALYADGSITTGNGVSVYGDVVSRGNLLAQNNTFYGFVVSEGSNNTLGGTITINNINAPQTFNPTPLNAQQYSSTSPISQSNINEPIGLLGLTWAN